MIPGKHKVLQAFLGTLLTWGLTAVGSAMVFIFGAKKFKGKVIMNFFLSEHGIYYFGRKWIVNPIVSHNLLTLS